MKAIEYLFDNCPEEQKNKNTGQPSQMIPINLCIKMMDDFSIKQNSVTVDEDLNPLEEPNSEDYQLESGSEYQDDVEAYNQAEKITFEELAKRLWLRGNLVAEECLISQENRLKTIRGLEEANEEIRRLKSLYTLDNNMKSKHISNLDEKIANQKAQIDKSNKENADLCMEFYELKSHLKTKIEGFCKNQGYSITSGDFYEMLKLLS